MLKFVMNNPDYRGKGYGKEMLQLTIRFAFEITGVQAVHFYLSVYKDSMSPLIKKDIEALKAVVK